MEAIHHGPTWIPVRKFYFAEVHPILREIKSRKKNDIIRVSLTNYLIIRLVSSFECYLINRAQRYVEAYNTDLSILFDEVRDDRKPKGKIVASSFNYANLNDVNYVFSKLLNMDFLSEVKKWSEINFRDYYYESEHILWASPLHRNWNNFIQIFELRDQIVHKMKKFVLHYKEIRNLAENILDFLVTCSVIIPT